MQLPFHQMKFSTILRQVKPVILNQALFMVMKLNFASKILLGKRRLRMVSSTLSCWRDQIWTIFQKGATTYVNDKRGQDWTNIEKKYFRRNSPNRPFLDIRWPDSWGNQIINLGKWESTKINKTYWRFPFEKPTSKSILK